MSRTTFAVVASAVMAAACGNPSPTAVANSPDGRPGGTFSALETNACAAQSMSLLYFRVGSRHLITVEFLDARHNDIYPLGCPALTWSVTPDGAHVQPLYDGSRLVTQAELIVTGATQVYTVTAASGTLRASIGITAGR